MKDEEDISLYSLEDLRAMQERGETHTRADAPAYPVDEEFWKHARVTMPHGGGKASVHLRIDADVLAWFKAQGKGHLTHMNAVLRSYMEAHR